MPDDVPMMTNREAHDLWVAALRDTDTYPQTKGALQNEDGYCCLGVLCEVAVKAGVQISVLPVPGNPALIAYDGEVEHLPGAVVDWAGLDTNNPVVLVDEDEEDDDGVVQYERELVMLNDDWVWSFPDIANVIEAQL